MLRLALLAALLPGLAFAQVQLVANASPDPSCRLVNCDPAAMHEIHVRHAQGRDVRPNGIGACGTDRLGQDVLVPGRVARISLPVGQCVNDIRVIFADGRAVEHRRTDTCAQSQVTIP